MKSISFISAFLISIMLPLACSEPSGSNPDLPQSVSDPEAEMPTYLSPQPMHDARPVTCQGYVEAPPQARFSMRVPIAGLVQQIRPLPGALVRQGQLIASLSHPDYIHLQQQYLEAKAEQAYLEAAIDRQTQLRGQGATTEREYTRTLADKNIGAAGLAGMAAELRLIGIDPEKLSDESLTSVISIYSPETAYVTSVGVSVGELAGPQQEICQMVKLEHLHVEAAVYEQDRHRVRIGQKVSYRVAGSEEVYSGRVLLIGQQVNPEARSVQVHIEPDSEKGLIPGAYVTANLEAEAESLWLIPEAVLAEGQQGLEVELDTGGSTVRVPLAGGRRTTEGYVLAELPPSLRAESRLLVQKVEGGGHAH